MGARYAVASKQCIKDLGVKVPSMRIATPTVGIVHLFKLLETARGEFLCWLATFAAIAASSQQQQHHWMLAAGCCMLLAAVGCCWLLLRAWTGGMHEPACMLLQQQQQLLLRACVRAWPPS